MKFIKNTAVVFAFIFSNQVFADTSNAHGDPEKGKEIAMGVCSGCHNADGNSVIPSNPTLAGQHAEYITKQLMDFKVEGDSPAKRDNPTMASMVAALTVDDMKNLSAYYAQQKTKVETISDGGKSLLEIGKRVYDGGNLEHNVPACSSCHSPNGAGIPPHYPKLAGQHTIYTISQLEAFRQGSRANDKNQEMQKVVLRMSAQEMKAVAEYIATLQ
ncbi:cytochrome c [Nitrosomonas sp. Nm132]|jgi:cytochrome c553|uniref:c-type cytochrome n=1 Tax=Nitrosomonas sp. Nm132 TaxID=1881053 RepID=UPI000883365B|nr:c-type cytochrome [Nitrosomonas sp. Nm132]SDH50887.1 Cytochrome c553 [Nitrosomonas sp. Nm132]